MSVRRLLALAMFGSGGVVLACSADRSTTGDGDFLTAPADGGKVPSVPTAPTASTPPMNVDGAAPSHSGAQCDYMNTCQGAADVGSIAADTPGAQGVTYEGSTSAWVAVRAAEQSAGGGPLKVHAELTVPPGSNFDLFMYADSDTGEVSCSKLAAKGTSPDANEIVEAEWGEGFFPNLTDDARAIRFEVRHVSGTCDPSAKWKLSISGYK